MIEPVMRRVKGDGIGLQLAIWEGYGKTILSLHGLTANCRCWDVIASALTPRHRLLAVDLRGRGLSEKPLRGYSERQHAADIRSLMDDMKLEKVVLMGHSLGGYIAMQLAAQSPDRIEGLILIDSGGDLPQEHWDRVGAAIRISVERLDQIFPSFQAFIEMMKIAPPLQPWLKAFETYFRYDMEEVEGGVRSRIRKEGILEEMANKRETATAHLYPKMTSPVLILRATEGILSPDDILLPEPVMDRMLKEIPHACRYDVKGTNHYGIIFQPHPGRDKAILDFLEESIVNFA
jgi:pimeloyl-ACP methyl ester carboxylesterase